MKTNFKILAIFLAIFILASSFTGCRRSYQDAIIYFEAAEQPYSLDPQTASTDTELIIIRNIYEGLLRKNSTGAIICGVAENFTYSNLTYTFKLRKDAVWSNKEQITADDFVFAFKRAVDPKTAAPFVFRLFSIVGAEKIYNGDASVDTLGVSAPDKYTLKIKLCRKDNDFKETLTTSIAMPCNESFFNEAAGKYGLSKETTISNGSYQLRKWNKESFGIRLYKNNDYTGSTVAKNSAVYITKSEKETPIERLKDNGADIAFIDSFLVDEAKESSLKTKEFENICWVLTINSNLTLYERKALAMLIGKDVYSANLKNGYSPAISIYPSALKTGAQLSGTTPYNLEAAKELFARENRDHPKNEGSSKYTLYYYDNPVIKSIVADIAGHWQNNFGKFVVNIQPSDNLTALKSELQNQTLDFAVFPIRAESKNIGEYLANFGIYDSDISLSAAQTKILENNNIIPLIFQNTTIAYSQSLNDVYTELGNGYIDFSLIVKTE